MDTQVVCISPDMIEAALASAPTTFTLYGRDPAFDIVLEPGLLYFGLGGTPEPFFYDHALRASRSPTKADMAACTRVGQALPQIDVVHLTRVHAMVAADTYLPPFDAAAWDEVAHEEHAADERHAHAFSFIELRRRASPGATAQPQ
jgi:trimethylamine:corrinoid methyltransferase-like protein